MNIDISIIVPIYNAEKTLEKCISSLLNQNYDNYEIILINDGSKDKSLMICENYSKICKNIKIFNKENEGSSIARNIGIDIAKGEYLMFVDSDDWIEPNMIKEKYELAKKNNSDMIISGIKFDYINRNQKISTIINSYKVSYWRNKHEVRTNIINLFENALINSSCNKLYKSKILKENNIYFPKTEVGEDTLFNLKVLEDISSIVITDKSYYHYIRINNKNTLTTKIINDAYSKYACIHAEMLSLFKKWNMLNDHVIKCINRTMISQYLSVTYKILRNGNMPYNEKKYMLDKGFMSILVQNTFKSVQANTWFESIFRLLIRKRRYYIATKVLRLIDIKKSIRK